MKIKFNLIKCLFASLLTSISINAFSQVNLGLEPGVTVTDLNINQIASTSHEYARARKNHKINDDGGVVAFVKLANSDMLFLLSRNNVLHLTNFDTRQPLGRWPLTRWPHEYILPEITTRLNQEQAYEFSPTPGVTQLEPGAIYNGCLSQNPLRYGDVDGNGNKEIVLLMDQDIVFFSPDQKKVIFQLRWIDDRSDGDYEDDNGPIEKDPDDPTIWPQFRDPYVNEGGNGPLYKGLRAYAKMYLGEFNSNQTPDIVVWYKVYESNMRGDLLGFTKVNDTVKHYELIAAPIDDQQPTGEYLPINTPEDTIRQWLVTKDLTWQKGYPNLSECVGQTDKHIPEMIDPLLNDPDVLK